MEKFSFDGALKKTADTIKDQGSKVVKIGMTAAVAMSSFGQPTDAKAQGGHEFNPKGIEITMGRLTNPELKSHIDSNMPEGIKREFVYVAEDTSAPVASVFWIDETKAKTSLKSNDLHPDAFGRTSKDTLDYSKLNQELEKSGQELAIAFAGPYKSPSGNIEGVAIENGRMVGETNYSKWAGFLYMTPDGKMEMYRMKDATNNFDKAGADNLVNRATQEGGSLFQQIPAIWNGKKMLNSTSTDKFEWRAICQTKDGRKIIMNTTTKMTQEEFLIMCLDLKDAQGNLVIDDLLLTDTGVYSEGVFRDQDQVKDNTGFKSYAMKDEQYPNKKGYTNAVVISIKKQ